MQAATKAVIKIEGGKKSDYSADKVKANQERKVNNFDYDSMAEEIRKISVPYNFENIKRFYNR